MLHGACWQPLAPSMLTHCNALVVQAGKTEVARLHQSASSTLCSIWEVRRLSFFKCHIVCFFSFSRSVGLCKAQLMINVRRTPELQLTMLTSSVSCILASASCLPNTNLVIPACPGLCLAVAEFTTLHMRDGLCSSICVIQQSA